MRVKYGYSTDDNSFVHVSDFYDIENAVKMVAKSLRIKKFDCDYKFIETDSGRYVEAYYESNIANYTCSFRVYEETLLEIGGHLHCLPRWCFDDRQTT